MAVHVILSGGLRCRHAFIGSGGLAITRPANVNSVAEPGSGASAKRKSGDDDGSQASASEAERRRPGFEQARDELTELVKRLEAGGLTLEQSLQLWERGEQLAAICEDWLEGARARMAAALARREDTGESPAAPF
jgi:exodeoxyribonuclease VII small subunit